MRQFWVSVHRWLGLTTAVFLIVAGLTGSVVTFYEELDHYFSSPLYELQSPPSGRELLSAYDLREHVLAQQPSVAVTYLLLEVSPDRNSIVNAVSAQRGVELDNDQFFVDPYTGKIRGARRWGDIRQGMHNLIPFMYVLHRQLALGTVGTYLLGIIALIWTIDCFVGLYLTFPPRRRQKALARVDKALVTWLRRWKPSWTIRWPTKSYKFNFDLHRAGGVWMWGMLLVLAWSSVGFNLYREVYHPVMSLVFEMESGSARLGAADQILVDPPISFRRAGEIAAELAEKTAREAGYTPGAGEALSYRTRGGIYSYKFVSDADIRDEASSRIFFSATDGELLGSYLPNGEGNGEIVSGWIMALHTATVGGLAIRIFICFLGVVTAMLSVTGIIVWARKRRARSGRRVANGTKPRATELGG